MRDRTLLKHILTHRLVQVVARAQPVYHQAHTAQVIFFQVLWILTIYHQPLHHSNMEILRFLPQLYWLIVMGNILRLRRLLLLRSMEAIELSSPLYHDKPPSSQGLQRLRQSPIYPHPHNRGEFQLKISVLDINNIPNPAS